MSEINAKRCIASQIIIDIMNSDDPKEEKAEQLKLLWAHAESAYERVTGEKPTMGFSPEERRELNAALDAYDNIVYVLPEHGLVHKSVSGTNKTLCGIRVKRTWRRVNDRRFTGVAGNCDKCWRGDC